MLYSYLWIIFIIIAVICVIMQSLPLLGGCFLLMATALLMYDLIYFRRFRFMSLWLYTAGALMAVPTFYSLYLGYIGKILPGNEAEQQIIILSLVVLYAILSIVDGAVDFVMRRVRCKAKINAYLSERNIRRRDEKGDMTNKQLTMVNYSYNGKQYEYKGNITTNTKGPNSQGKSVQILIDKHCPQYINAAGIQGNNIFSIVRGVIILLLIAVIVCEAL